MNRRGFIGVTSAIVGAITGPKQSLSGQAGYATEDGPMAINRNPFTAKPVSEAEGELISKAYDIVFKSRRPIERELALADLLGAPPHLYSMKSCQPWWIMQKSIEWRAKKQAEMEGLRDKIFRQLGLEP